MICDEALLGKSFGQLLVHGRRAGVGQPNREPKLQEDLAKAICRGLETTSLYERDKRRPPDHVFDPRLKPGQREEDLRGIIPFFTRPDPDPDEVEFLEALRTAYASWPNKAKPDADPPPDDLPLDEPMFRWTGQELLKARAWEEFSQQADNVAADLHRTTHAIRSIAGAALVLLCVGGALHLVG